MEGEGDGGREGETKRERANNTCTCAYLNVCFLFYSWRLFGLFRTFLSYVNTAVRVSKPRPQDTPTSNPPQNFLTAIASNNNNYKHE